MLQLGRKFAVLDIRLGQRAFKFRIVPFVHVEADLIFGFGPVFDELGIAQTQRRFTRRPFMA